MCRESVPGRFRRPHGLWRIYAGAVANEKFYDSPSPRDHATRRDLSPKITMVVGSIVRRRGSGSGYRQADKTAQGETGATSAKPSPGA